MAPKRRPAGQPWKPLQEGSYRPTARQRELLDAAGEPPPTSVWFNDRYQVQLTELDTGLTHLSIRREDRDWPRDWRHFQRIKNELCGEEREACELYPAESRLLDGANQFHLWVLPAGLRFPFGYDGARSVMGPDDPRWQEFAGAAKLMGRQRPIEVTS
jgi:hypothetical protein